MSQLERLRSGRWLFLALANPGISYGGMPSMSLDEAIAARLDVISFFLFAFLASAWLLRWAWNVLAKDFPRLPELRYKNAVALLLVSSLFLYVILTMISGARELMTPGAWVKRGSTYQVPPPERDSKLWLESARRTAMQNLRDGLWRYAEAHGGELPPHQYADDSLLELWFGIYPGFETLAYVPGGKLGTDLRIVAYEPDSYGAHRYVIRLDGKIERLSVEELQTRLRAQVESINE